ncbi:MULTISPECIES: hypothetical protein [Prochlorococcus]|uniref:hypothetical protein n=1 Tax=Prochlorococcus TaxID=1218 RepID=UPI0005337839|nr:MULTISPECIES: hypothetical protein [Prochlorococcus]KGG13117.1 hypothetical protein EV05_0794 [Prochlorococcus sp. MIT 0601]
MDFIIALDPGRDKCGLLLADLVNSAVIEAYILKVSAVSNFVRKWQEKYSVKLIIIGNGTNSFYWVNEFATFSNLNVKVVEEAGTTFRARHRYWEIVPPGLLFRWLPRGLLPPPSNLDSIAALVLLEDYLSKKLEWAAEVNLKILP